MKYPNIAISTGGTGGHYFPAKALLKSLERDYRIQFFMDIRAFTYNDIKNNAHVAVRKITSKGLHKKSLLYLLIVALFVGLGTIQSLYYFIKVRPKVLITFGGYASFPTAVAAIILRIPIIVHEQNAVIGKANRIISVFAKKIATTFENTVGVKKNAKNIVVGLPVRSEFSTLDLSVKHSNDSITVTVIGGSQGASIFAQSIPNAFLRLNKAEQAKFIVNHQCRLEYMQAVEEIWANTKVTYNVMPFFNNIATIMQNSDVIISRSGASSIFEIVNLGKYAIYVPFAKAYANHQEANAKEIEKISDCMIILEKDFTDYNLCQVLQNLQQTKIESKRNLELAILQRNNDALIKLKNIIIDIIK